jgi:hypothetical protein
LCCNVLCRVVLGCDWFCVACLVSRLGGVVFVDFRYDVVGQLDPTILHLRSEPLGGQLIRTSMGPPRGGSLSRSFWEHGN